MKRHNYEETFAPIVKLTTVRTYLLQLQKNGLLVKWMSQTPSYIGTLKKKYIQAYLKDLDDKGSLFYALLTYQLLLNFLLIQCVSLDSIYID